MPAAPGQHRRKAVGKGHTAKHRTPENRDAAHKRGYDKRWERFRAGFLMAHPLCEYCLADGRTEPATVCDHDLPHRGDPDAFWGNTFTALCRRHHNGEKARVESRLSGDRLLAWVRHRKTPRGYQRG